MEIFEKDLNYSSFILLVGNKGNSELSFCHTFSKIELQNIISEINLDIVSTEFGDESASNKTTDPFVLSSRPILAWAADLRPSSTDKLKNKYNFINSENHEHKLFIMLYHKHINSSGWFFLCVGVDEDEKNIKKIEDIFAYNFDGTLFPFLNEDGVNKYIERCIDKTNTLTENYKLIYKEINYAEVEEPVVFEKRRTRKEKVPF